MAKLTVNSLLKGLRGKIDNLVVREIRGQLFIGRKPRPRGKRSKPTPAQAAHRGRFKAASEYAKAVQRDAALLAFYAPFARARGLRVRAVALSDFFHPPKVEAIDLRRYRGRAGDPITVRATDAFGVVSVTVSICSATGAVLETGEASLRARRWHYTATRTLAAGQPVTVEAVAYDRPRRQGTLQVAWPTAV